jgi:hypothetical protein
MALPVPRSWRPVSGLEKAWLVADRLAPPFANQLVIEGTGRLDPELVQVAANRVAVQMPGVCVRRRGWLGGMRWESTGVPPVVRVDDGSAWDGQGPAGAPFLTRPMDPARGPVCEVVVVKGSADGVDRIVVRTHHAALDGRGAGLFAADLFAVLRGEEPKGAKGGPFTDVDLARMAEVPPRKDPEPDRGSPTGAPTSDAFETTWARRRVPGRFRGLLPRAIVGLWQASRTYCTDPLRFGVPVDLRRYNPELRSTANLTGILHIDLDGVDSVARAHARVRARLTHGLEGHAAAAHVLGVDGLRGLPLWFMGWAGARAAKQGLQTGRFRTSVTLSNLGRQDLSQYRGGGFEAKRAFWIPPGQPGLPLFLAMAGDAEGLELVGSMPVGLADGGRLEGLLEGMAEALVSEAGRVTQ